MNPNNRTIDHLHIAVVGLGNRVHQPVPYPGLAPSIEAIVGGGVGAIAARQIAPWRSRTQNPKDAVHDAAVILAPRAGPALRKQRLNDAPLEVGQIELLPVPRTLGLGVMMGPEVADGTTEFQPGVQARGGAVGARARRVDCASRT